MFLTKEEKIKHKEHYDEWYRNQAVEDAPLLNEKENWDVITILLSNRGTRLTELELHALQLATYVSRDNHEEVVATYYKDIYKELKELRAFKASIIKAVNV